MGLARVGQLTVTLSLITCTARGAEQPPWHRASRFDPAAARPAIPDTVAVWEFDGSSDGWARSNVDVSHLHASAHNGRLRLILSSTSESFTPEAAGWMDSPALGVPIAPQAPLSLLMRARAQTHSLTTAVWFLIACDGSAAHSRPFESGAPFVNASSVTTTQPGEWHTVRVDMPPLETNGTCRLTRMRVFPAVTSSVTALDIEWVRLMHVPTIVAVEGCSTQQAVTNASLPRMTRDLACNVGSSTLACAPAGGDRIYISGHALGMVPPFVYVGGQPCTQVRMEVHNALVSCVTPPLRNIAAATAPLMVALHHGTVPTLSFEAAALSYARYDASMLSGYIANVAATSVDIVPVWSCGAPACACGTTAFLVQWRAGAFDDVVQNNASYTLPLDAPWPQLLASQRFDARSGGGVTWQEWSVQQQRLFANVSVATLRGLPTGTAVQIRIAPVAQLVEQPASCYDDLPPLAVGAARGVVGPWTAPIATRTLLADVLFPRFDASSRLNYGATVKAPNITNFLGESSGQGHFGLRLQGSAHVANCNATHTCCDDFGGAEYAATERMYAMIDVYKIQSHGGNHVSALALPRHATSLNDTSTSRLLSWGLYTAPPSRLVRQNGPADAWLGADDDGSTVFMSRDAYNAEVAAQVARFAATNQLPTITNRVIDQLDAIASADKRTAGTLGVRTPDGLRVVPLAADPRAFCSVICTAHADADAPQLYRAQSLNASTQHDAVAGLPSVDMFQSPVRGKVPTSPCGPALRLTPAARNQRGTALYARPLNIAEGFDTSFVFRISNPSSTCRIQNDVHTHCRASGGDLFSFVVVPIGEAQSCVAITFASAGHEMGFPIVYTTLRPQSGTPFNVSRQSVLSLDWSAGIHIARVTYQPLIPAGASQDAAFQPAAWMEHCPSTDCGLLKVWVDDVEVLSSPFPLARVMQSFKSRNELPVRTSSVSWRQGYVGFHAETSERLWQTHDILSWSFTQLRGDVQLQC